MIKDEVEAHIKIKEEVYDYGSISNRDKKVVEEVLKYIDVSLHDTVKDKFEIKTRPIYNVKKHPLWKICQENNISLNLQGFDYSADVNSMRYPIYGLCEDFRKLERLYTAIVTDVTNKLRPNLKSDTIIDTE